METTAEREHDVDEAAIFERPWARLARTWLGPDERKPGYLWARWLFLRALGLWFFSAFYSLAFQIRGLVGPDGITPARAYLELVRRAYPSLARFWYAPTLFWISPGKAMCTIIVAGGIVASSALVLDLFPRAAIAACVVFFLSFVASTEVFSSYQSDGMLLEAGFLSLFFAPPGLRPGLGAASPPSKISLFLLRWEWFRIYFESGIVKLASGDTEWRDFTAMDHYYEYGPLPTWLGWHAQHLPHGFHAATVGFTLGTELILVWAMFLPRRFKLALFCIVTPMQIGIILTANYAFLNYIVLSLGVLLVDDGWLSRVKLVVPDVPVKTTAPWRQWASGAMFAWLFYASIVVFVFSRRTSELLVFPSELLEPFRFAPRYGLFAVMTRTRTEIEFQGSLDDGKTWKPYPFRYKPQELNAAPGIYAPYQPRFEWNLWFASLSGWMNDEWVIETQILLAQGDADVLRLFQKDPYDGVHPTRERTAYWQYWFSTSEEKRATGAWWKRQYLGTYSPTVVREPDGNLTFYSDDPARAPTP
jgi:hypothetical protein